MFNLILVMTGGAVGAAGRYLLSLAMLARFGGGFPAATLIANLAGGLLMGLLAGSLARSGGNEHMRLLIGVGVLGGFTTFSAFSLESWQMIARGQIGLATGYGLASVVGSILMLGAGLSIVRAVTS